MSARKPKSIGTDSSGGHRSSLIRSSGGKQGSRVTKRRSTQSSARLYRARSQVDDSRQSADTGVLLRVSPSFPALQLGRYYSTSECVFNWTYQSNTNCDMNDSDLWDEWELAERAVYKAGEESLSGVGRLDETLRERIDRFRATTEVEVARLTEGAGLKRLTLHVGPSTLGGWTKVKPGWVEKLSVKKHCAFDLQSDRDQPAAPEVATSEGSSVTTTAPDPSET